MIASVARYLSTLPNGRLVLWCYLIWWGSTVAHHFDPAPNIWLNSVGISGVIGIALILSVGGFQATARDRWQTFRLFAMPFCVSSFSSLIKGTGFVLIFPPSTKELVTSAGFCLAFCLLVFGFRKIYSNQNASSFHREDVAQQAEHASDVKR